MARLVISPPSPKKNPPVEILPDAEIILLLMVPVTLATLVAALNVNPALAPALPELLNSTCVLEPGTVRLPAILPAKVPMKYPPV